MYVCMTAAAKLVPSKADTNFITSPGSKPAPYECGLSLDFRTHMTFGEQVELPIRVIPVCLG